MPYIKQETRSHLDLAIEELAGELEASGHNEGDLNYAITRLILDWWNKETRYKTAARITGVLENVKQEFYRRHVAPYENKAIEKNGDI